MDIYFSDFFFVTDSAAVKHLLLAVENFSRVDTEKEFMMMGIFKIIIATYQFALWCLYFLQLWRQRHRQMIFRISKAKLDVFANLWDKNGVLLFLVEFSWK